MEWNLNTYHRTMVSRRYMKRSIALIAVALSFMLGVPATEAVLWVLWALFDAYVRIWLQKDAAFFIAQCCVCAAVVVLYGVLLKPPKRDEDGDCHLEGMSETDQGTSIRYYGLNTCAQCMLIPMHSIDVALTRVGAKDSKLVVHRAEYMVTNQTWRAYIYMRRHITVQSTLLLLI